jgi:NAD(P)-dependent dehydrogenase (short-subunit alcohol dehydrogenase family)
VCCAGIGSAWRTVGKDGTYESAHNQELFEWVVLVNLFGTFNCVRLAATAMSRLDPVDEFGEKGAIVTIASCAATEAQGGQAAYSAAKGGISAMTLPIARDLTPVGVRINCVAPGVIETPILEGHPTKSTEELKAELSRDVLFPKRIGTPDELASTILFLLTNSYANAETVRLDAGARMRPR